MFRIEFSCVDDKGQTNQLLQSIIERIETIMATQAEHAAELRAMVDKVDKIGAETRTLITKINDLTAAIEAAGGTTPEVEDAMAALKSQLAVVDDLVPDAPAEPEPPAPEEPQA